NLTRQKVGALFQSPGTHRKIERTEVALRQGPFRMQRIDVIQVGLFQLRQILSAIEVLNIAAMPKLIPRSVTFSEQFVGFQKIKQKPMQLSRVAQGSETAFFVGIGLGSDSQFFHLLPQNGGQLAGIWM